ncbi:hypothetical protein HMSSN036_89010 [Paenibacillus macerans]|nr:hypothetical protein HMSSN036_89010 [Paenibacillus macerans]
MPKSIKGTILVDGAEVPVSNPDKLLWPEAGINKRIYLEKLAELSPYLLKYCKNRLLTTIRYPGGIHGKFFYQKKRARPAPAVRAHGAAREHPVRRYGQPARPALAGQFGLH